MQRIIYLIFALLYMVTQGAWPQTNIVAKRTASDDKLAGTAIGSFTDMDSCQYAFDNDQNTYYAAPDSSYAWVGLDLGQPHVITRVCWSPRNDDKGKERMVLGVFEGANSEDFMDALPLYIITERDIIGTMSEADVSCSRGFRYVRYVGPVGAYCNVAELAFYGHAGEGDDSGLYRLTNQPTVTIHTKDGEIPYDKEHDITAQITIISNDGATVLSSPGTIRERGNFSRTFPKVPYRLKFDKKQKVPGATAKAKTWNLLNSSTDKTLMRNLIAMELSRCFQMEYTPYMQNVDVLLNGEYKGSYTLSDAIKVEKGRIELEEMKPEDNSGEALTGGYLVEIDAYASEENSWFTTANGIPVTIQYPDDDDITSQQQAYIEEAFNKMTSQWETYLDLNTFLRHFLINELAGNIDIYWSTYMYKYRGDDKIYTGPVWDFDLALENDPESYPTNEMTDFLYRSGVHYAGNMKDFVDQIIVYCDTAREQLLQIWTEARKSSITEQHLTDFIDSLEVDFEQTQHLNYQRWRIMNIALSENQIIWGSYEAEVQNVRRYLSERIAWMDSKLGYCDDTGITTTDITNDTDMPPVWYSLDGRRLNSQPSHPGVYICKGKKIIK